jgi:histidine triad (HIT) family protein
LGCPWIFGILRRVSDVMASLGPSAHAADCKFCRIITGEEEARVVCETETTLAFFPLKPAALGHTLVVPKQHVADLWARDLAVADDLMDAVIVVGRAIQDSLHPDGMNLISSAGEAATQTVFHLHLHVVPRWHGDHIGNLWPPAEPWGETVKDEVADLIRAACRH